MIQVLKRPFSLLLSLAVVSAFAFPLGAYAQTPSTLTDEEIEQVVGVSGDLAVDTYSLSGGGSDSVTTYAGDSMFETAILEARAAYPQGSTSAIIVGGPGGSWVDALSASGLAATKGPILFTWQDSLNVATKQTLLDMGVTSVVIIGGVAAVSGAVESQLQEAGVSVETRLWGNSCFDTQLAIYDYGVKNSYWSGDTAIVSTGTSFGDALSISPIAYAKKAPIFLTDGLGNLQKNQKDTLAQGAVAGMFSKVILTGGLNAVSERTEGFVSGLTYASHGSYNRLSGDTQYETSSAIAQWAVDTQGFSWNNLAFTTGLSPWDALAGSVLQGSSKSVLLLVSDSSSSTIQTAIDHKNAISQIRFFGGTGVVSNDTRNTIIAGLTDQLSVQDTGISLSRMLDMEYNAVHSSQPSYTKDQILESLNPSNFQYGEAGFYQFALVDQGYSGVVTADQLNGFIATQGANGMLAGQGAAFIAAARQYGTNEVYLLSHAILESGWGKSALARGWAFTSDVLDSEGKVLYKATGKTYYNFFGIGAYDSSPLSGGRLMAYQQNWDTPEKAIIGAAQWIAEGSNGSGCYFKNAWHQNTLYKMRWNFEQAARDNAVWKQYATSRTWATGIARVMDNCYSYNGITTINTGLNFSVPRYS
ncbi:MAG: cell wall-binding repeat-containing protein [Raoultibacter sp.]